MDKNEDNDEGIYDDDDDDSNEDNAQYSNNIDDDRDENVALWLFRRLEITVPVGWALNTNN